MHGSLFDVRCTSFYCNFAEQNNFIDPIVPALGVAEVGLQPMPSTTDKTGAEATNSLYEAMKQQGSAKQVLRELDISDENVPIPEIDIKDLPHCPECKDGLLRPGVVWFGEMLPERTMIAVDKFIEESKKIDLILVIGTSAKVYPAAGYVDRAREKGARVAVVNMDRADVPGGRNGLIKGDWFFEGDAGVIVPEMLKCVIGDI